MNTIALLRLATIAVASLTLSACQLDYGIDVAKRDGHVNFHVYRKGFGPNQPASVERLTVSEVSSPERKVWQVDSLDINGHELSDIGYGQVPSGLKQVVAPEPLKVGQLYVVSMYALGGMEIAYFVVSPEAGSGRPITRVPE